MRGWILDCYPDYERNRMVIWIKTNKGVEKWTDEFVPEFYVWAPKDQLSKVMRGLRTMGVEDFCLERKKTDLTEKEKEVIAITVQEYSSLPSLAKTIDSWGKYADFGLFNVDFRFDQRYFLEKNLFPMGLLDTNGPKLLDSPFRMDYPIPNLKETKLEVEVKGKGIPTLKDPIRRVHVDDVCIEGDEEAVLRELDALLKKIDPDVVHTCGGDEFYIPYLAGRAKLNGMRFDLGRERGERRSKGKSYFTYGRIVYKAPAHKPRGRVHIDAANSFIFSESGLHGLIDLSRLSSIPLQDLSRLSPGSAISAMQVNAAVRSGHLVLWKKNIPEGFKTAGALLISDRGGFIYEPRVGIHDKVAEVDFASLYPSIMVQFNISPETLLCSCCPQSRRIVPAIGYHICEKKTGLVPQVLEPIIKRRLAFKRMMKEGTRKRTIYEQRAKALKWVLVTCFGYTGYRNARFGRIECHESITAYGREILLKTSEIAENRGFEILHGIIDSLWIKGEGDAEAFCEEISKRIGIPLLLEGHYRWIVFLPNISTGVGALNRYYGLFENGEMKMRGIALRKKDTPQILEDLQLHLLDELTKAKSAEEFKGRIPAALEVMDSYVRKLREGSVPLDDLIIKRSVSQELSEYRQFNDSVAALRQLHSEGFEVPPGKSVEYVICDSSSKKAWERVKVASFLDGSETYDAERYVEFVLRATSELLSPFDYSFESLKKRTAK